ncbi:hypothetical protein M1M27_gp15 [Cellulophaga phage Ingeline_1]|uniref:Uncharacterized protein n=1 Tax=Cellulophaga phage Ingeline_1 TaxID=2745674 RepID=A0A8E4ZKE5_9CAUD|nr:hypothetical protein M1M27_gp15 [Cellulophaga phage Ingeline_1]QQV90024.1 hypothetical protein Ingeline2_36 [Cellulophaga phage Ingeline_2]QQV90074.1 hypothetical protein Ingeline3_36 [Cellulophaga phage Ingeline_3]QQV90124.1 hypothetical protein Ingeline4_36 [Cellulophaga phage Ingeline_4]QQV90173.1 hypothetical protein Ingeline5_35 [Cellulophaga phage Ingeline_5]QQV90223.1 hypothetical protein Ingeline6_36 [Cellulophaga phage Ingeline_6]QQV90273.1 hypothetical protein Ingeline7_36 [Cellu
MPVNSFTRILHDFILLKQTKSTLSNEQYLKELTKLQNNLIQNLEQTTLSKKDTKTYHLLISSIAGSR